MLPELNVRGVARTMGKRLATGRETEHQNDPVFLRPDIQPTSARFHEDMNVPDWFDPGQVDVSDSASPPRRYPPNVDACLRWLCLPGRTIASQ